MINKVLVTGSAGFIGFHLCKKLLQLGYEVFGVDNFNDYYDVKLKKDRNKILKKYSKFKGYKLDISDYTTLFFLLHLSEVDVVINLAAQAGVRRSLKEPHIYEEYNIKGFLNILEACRKQGKKKIIYASSGSVYGNNTKIPFSENDDCSKPANLYGATKKCNELMAYSYSNLFDLQTIGLRFFSVYGPWGRPDMALWQFTENIINNIPIDVYNNGNMKRDFTYVDDLIDGIISVIENIEDLNKNEIFNLSSGKNANLSDIIHIIEKELHKKAILNYLPMQPGDIRESLADITKASSILNYNPKISIKEGISKFIKWYKEYKNDKNN